MFTTNFVFGFYNIDYTQILNLLASLRHSIPNMSKIADLGTYFKPKRFNFDVLIHRGIECEVKEHFWWTLRVCEDFAASRKP